MNLKEILPALLRQKGWTQDRLADETGIKRTDINAFARGRKEAGPVRLRRIAEALEVSVYELGATEAQARREGSDLPTRLESIAEALEVLLDGQQEALRLLRTRVAQVEQRDKPSKGASTRRRKGS